MGTVLNRHKMIFQTDPAKDEVAEPTAFEKEMLELMKKMDERITKIEEKSRQQRFLSICPFVTDTPIERSVTLDVAEDFIRSKISSIGLTPQLSISGVEAFAATCSLYDRYGKVVSQGHGKGNLKSATTGALFEAAEHFLSEFQQIPRQVVRVKPVLDVLKSIADPERLPFRLLAEDTSKQITTLLYKQVNGSKEFSRPLALCCPGFVDEVYKNNDLVKKDNFDYGRLQLYATNSGVAAGYSKTEAIIHGLLESCERDAISQFLLEVFIMGKSSRLVFS